MHLPLALQPAGAWPHCQIVHRACCDVNPLYIDVGKLAVSSGHLKTTMPKHPLKAEHIAAVSEKTHRRGVAQGMRRASYALQASRLTIDCHPLLDAVPG